VLQIDRDPNNKRLQIEVENKLEEIFNNFEPKKEQLQIKNNLKDISVEDAVKELLSMGIKA
jgi:hypothetical protein